MVDVIFDNLNAAVGVLPESLVNGIGSLVLILKAVGIAFIVYAGYLILKALMNIRRYKMLKRIDERVERLEKKLDRVLKEKKKGSQVKVSKKLNIKKKSKSR